MLFWLGVAAVIGLVVYLGHRYDRKHGGHVRGRTTQRHGSVDAAVFNDTSSTRGPGPLG
jgi:hypothetical protein